MPFGGQARLGPRRDAGTVWLGRVACSPEATRCFVGAVLELGLGRGSMDNIFRRGALQPPTVAGGQVSKEVFSCQTRYPR
jgi:hypothetical protein